QRGRRDSVNVRATGSRASSLTVTASPSPRSAGTGATTGTPAKSETTPPPPGHGGDDRHVGQEHDPATAVTVDDRGGKRGADVVGEHCGLDRVDARAIHCTRGPVCNPRYTHP